MVFSYLKNNKNSRSYRCSNIAKTRVFRTFRLGLLEILTWWSKSEPGFDFYAKNYFGNDYRYFYNNHNLIFCRPVLLFMKILGIWFILLTKITMYFLFIINYINKFREKLDQWKNIDRIQIWPFNLYGLY